MTQKTKAPNTGFSFYLAYFTFPIMRPTMKGIIMPKKTELTLTQTVLIATASAAAAWLVEKGLTKLITAK
jgi:hypothetical protein